MPYEHDASMSVKISLSGSEAELHYCAAWTRNIPRELFSKFIIQKLLAFHLTENFLSDIYQDAAVHPDFC